MSSSAGADAGAVINKARSARTRTAAARIRGILPPLRNTTIAPSRSVVRRSMWSRPRREAMTGHCLLQSLAVHSKKQTLQTFTFSL